MPQWQAQVLYHEEYQYPPSTQNNWWEGSIGRLVSNEGTHDLEYYKIVIFLPLSQSDLGNTSYYVQLTLFEWQKVHYNLFCLPEWQGLFSSCISEQDLLATCPARAGGQQRMLSLCQELMPGQDKVKEDYVLRTKKDCIWLYFVLESFERLYLI